MITPELLARINELARKKRSEGLTDAEKIEQKKLYEVYLAGIRGQMINLLDSIEFVDETPNDKKKLNNKGFIHHATINLERVYH